MKRILEIIFKKINKMRGLGKAQDVGTCTELVERGHISPIQRGYALAPCIGE